MLTTNSSSQYFSPKKSRNKIKIEYDERLVEKSAVGTEGKKPKVESTSGDETDVKKSKWEPNNWNQTFQNMRKMRKVNTINMW